jgi:2-polyprenyl-3-methyl-5-hydroxy-6-metoxy-1,4-benzoquinol methylase
MENIEINFDSVHTSDKQKYLSHEFDKITEEIHKIFPQIGKVMACPVCGSSKINYLTRKFGYNIDICAHCSHIFTNPFPSEESLQYFYNSSYKEFENKFFLESKSARLKIYEYRVQKLLEYTGPHTSFLNVGAAIGLFEEAMRKHKRLSNFHSVEINKSSAKLLKQQFPEINVINVDIMNYNSSKGYDIITLWDTLEHLTNVRAFTAKVVTLLNPGGVFAFSTPNTDSYEWWAAGIDHPQLLPPGHVNLFNKNNIRSFLKDQGLEIVMLETPNASLDLSFVDKYVASLGEVEYSDKNLLIRKLSDIISEDSYLHETLQAAIKESKCAGNMFVIARRAF